MIRTQIQLTEEQSKNLKKIAALRGLSIAKLIRQGIDQVLRSDTSTLSQDDRKQRALAAAGRFRSTTGDLSTNHDKHLIEAFRK